MDMSGRTGCWGAAFAVFVMQRIAEARAHDVPADAAPVAVSGACAMSAAAAAAAAVSAAEVDDNDCRRHRRRRYSG